MEYFPLKYFNHTDNGKRDILGENGFKWGDTTFG